MIERERERERERESQKNPCWQRDLIMMIWFEGTIRYADSKYIISFFFLSDLVIKIQYTPKLFCVQLVRHKV